jgi:arylsulfatase A-like enzyme
MKKPSMNLIKNNFAGYQTILAVVFVFVATFSGFSQGVNSPEASKAGPNILFIAIDDLNSWIGSMGKHGQTKTPNIDRLAQMGVLFENAHCQAPLCGPSRASLMSGLRPSTTGIYGMIDDEKIVHDNAATKDVVFLPEYFKKEGYHTMGIGKLFHEHAPEGQFHESGGRVRGFGPTPEKRFVWEGYAGDNYGRTGTDWGAYPMADSLMPDYQSAQWAAERLKRDYDSPFFLAVGFLRPHAPWYAPQQWFDLHPVETLEMPPYKPDDLEDVPPVALKINDLPMMPTTDWAIETDNWKYIIQGYLACISFVDAQVGKLLEALESSPYADNTIVVLWSDHGYRLGEKGTFAKHALWEEATKSPLIFSGPGIPAGKVVDEPVELLSIYPTLVELASLPKNNLNEGTSLVPLLKDTDAEREWMALTTYGMKNHGVRTKKYRYIQYEDGSEELYDHETDPNEWTNLANDQKFLNIKAAIKKHLPKHNAPWTKHSSYSFQPYFVDQKERSDKGLIK